MKSTLRDGARAGIVGDAWRGSRGSRAGIVGGAWEDLVVLGRVSLVATGGGGLRLSLVYVRGQVHCSRTAVFRLSTSLRQYVQCLLSRRQ